MRRIMRSALVGCSLVVGIAGGACSDLRTFDEPGGIVIYDAGPGSAPDGGIRPTRPVITGEISPVYGFVSPAAKTEYYYLGEVDRQGESVPVNPIYFFYDEQGTPLFRLAQDGSRLVGWHPVVDVVPTQTGYSPFWRVHRVRVKGVVDEAALERLTDLPDAKHTCQMDSVCTGDQRCIEDQCVDPIRIGIFDLDAIKSMETLEQSRLIISATQTIINCPIVDADAKLLKGLADPDKPFPKIPLWYARLKAFCYLMEGGQEMLGAGAGSLPPGGPPPAADAYFIERELAFGTDDVITVLPKMHLVLTEHLPGSPGYSPLVRELRVAVGKDHVFQDVRSVAEAKSKGLPIETTTSLHNLVVRGTLPACVTNADCAATGGKVDPPLKCSVEQGYCSPPFARLFEECRAGVKECDPKGGPGGTAMICLGLRVRKKFFCFNTCNSDLKDENPDPKIDTRCGSVEGLQCYTRRRTDPTQPNGVCIQDCNSRKGSKEDLINQCVSKTCGNGKLENGEACDDKNQANRDGCNEFCTLSTFARCEGNADCKGTLDHPSQACGEPASGQGMTYCLPSDKEKDERADEDKYRTICMEYDWCWPPDERADWLGKKEEEQ